MAAITKSFENGPIKSRVGAFPDVVGMTNGRFKGTESRSVSFALLIIDFIVILHVRLIRVLLKINQLSEPRVRFKRIISLQAVAQSNLVVNTS